MSLRVLFFDMNCYFASVEQQLRPELRGRPVGIVPVVSEGTCCIAASVEAKARGVKTGTGVREARALCPEITLVRSRPDVYVRVHHRVIEAVETRIPVHAMRSVDEGVCRLGIGERDRASAEALAMGVKAAIRERVGAHLRCSIGLAPNEMLAKTGTDMRKPDGLVTIEKGDLPEAICGLALTDLPGIGRRMGARLEGAGIRSVRDLCARSEKELERVWGGVVGRRWWYWLRGEELRLPSERTRTIGHQHVLAPAMRTEEGARAVAFRLLHKAAARARHTGYAARTLWVGVRSQSAPGVREVTLWERTASLGPGCVDTGSMARVLAGLWAERPRVRPVWVGITLLGLVRRETTLALFERERADEALASAMDRINAKHGRNTLYYASMHAAREQRVGGIAFSSVPDLSLPDAVA